MKIIVSYCLCASVSKFYILERNYNILGICCVPIFATFLFSLLYAGKSDSIQLLYIFSWPKWNAGLYVLYSRKEMYTHALGHVAVIRHIQYLSVNKCTKKIQKNNYKSPWRRVKKQNVWKKFRFLTYTSIFNVLCAYRYVPYLCKKKKTLLTVTWCYN